MILSTIEASRRRSESTKLEVLTLLMVCRKHTKINQEAMVAHQTKTSEVVSKRAMTQKGVVSKEAAREVALKKTSSTTSRRETTSIIVSKALKAALILTRTEATVSSGRRQRLYEYTVSDLETEI